MKVSLTDQPCTGWNINLMLPKVVKHNGAHELFMNTYGRRRRRRRSTVLLVMCLVSTNGERAGLANLHLTIGSLLECS